MRLRTLIPSLLFGLLSHCTAYSQTSVDLLRGSSDAAQGVFDRISGNTSADTVEQAACGCQSPDWIWAYLVKNVHYPEPERDAGIHGRVYVQFIVNKEGNTQDVKVVRGVSPGLDAEAARAVENMPAWTPARMNGKPVITPCVIPIVFSLPKSDSCTCHITMADSIPLFKILEDRGLIKCEDLPLEAMGAVFENYSDSSLLREEDFDKSGFGVNGYFIYIWEEKMQPVKGATVRVINIRVDVDGSRSPECLRVTVTAEHGTRGMSDTTFMQMADHVKVDYLWTEL
jgi:TonB family protein